MFGRKTIVVKKDIIPAEKVDPRKRRKGLGETRFDRYDIPGETAKAVRKILLLILALFLVWFFYQSAIAWDIFQ